MDNMKFGLGIQKHREAARLSQQQLAEAVGLSTVFISFLERGLRLPNLKNFINIANALEVSADDLLAGLIKCGYKSQASHLTQILEQLSPNERARILSVVETMTKPFAFANIYYKEGD